MFLNILTLFTAISISVVAAWYSIIGLTAIFSGAVIPIIILGSVLEFAKVVTTVWVHNNWQKINWIIRTYLSVCVVMLMVITSLGIFGFLSRAHIDATSSVGDNQLLIEQIEQQITVERSRIEDSQRVIAQMDTAVNNILNQSSNQKTVANQRGSQVATQANQLRNTQKKERDGLNKTIDDTNKRIGDLNIQKLKLQQSQAKVEAEVGPLKYIAQLIYGDQVNKDLLERAVRIVIIIMVAVFDPLAVCLVLAVTMSISSTQRKKKNEEQEREVSEESRTTDNNPSTGSVGEENSPGVDRSSTEEPTIQYIERVIEKEVIKEVPVEVEKIVEKPVEIIKEVEVIKEVPVEDHTRMIELAKEIDNLLVELDKKNSEVNKYKAQVELLEQPNNFKLDSALIGSTIPATGNIGQLFCNTLRGKIELLKWNGDKWIVVDKKQNRSYLADSPILDDMVTMIASGELIWDLLDEEEQEAVEPLLNKDDR